MNKLICFFQGIRTVFLLVLVLGCPIPGAVMAQGTNSITEYVPTFLEQQLEARDPTLNVLWEWSKVEGQRYAYEISIISPTSWASARFCVDGEQSKTIAPSVSRFVWSFKSLPVGMHTITLLITDDEGNIGVASRPVRIR